MLDFMYRGKNTLIELVSPNIYYMIADQQTRVNSFVDRQIVTVQGFTGLDNLKILGLFALITLIFQIIKLQSTSLMTTLNT